MSTMISSLWTIFWTVLNVLIFYFLMKKILFKPVNKVMDERAKQIQDNIDNAKKSRADADSLKKQYEGSIEKARDEAKQIVQNANSQALSISEKKRAEAEAEALKIKEAAKKEIEQ